MSSSSPPRASLSPARPAPLLASFDIDGLAAYIIEKKPKKIIVMMGAGASVAAGIPDFRSPGVGLYSKLAQIYPELAQNPEKLFDLDAFRKNPALFYHVINEMGLWPDNYTPTPAHRFVRLLQDKGILLRCYTQNIDTLERTAGIREELLVEAHGAFASAHCIECKAPVSIDHVQECAKASPLVVPRCTSTPECGGLVKPDVVFFGESLPTRFFELFQRDSDQCDMLIIIGTSLKVYPFAMLPSLVRGDIPRVLVNMTRAGDRTFVFQTDVNGAITRKDGSLQNTSSSSSSSDTSSEHEQSPRRGRSVSDSHNVAAAENEGVVDEEDENEDEEYAGSSSSSEGPNATPLPDSELRYCFRDLLLAGDCQESIQKLVNALGWELPVLVDEKERKGTEGDKRESAAAGAVDFDDI